MIDLHTQLLTIVGTVIVVGFLLLLLAPALEHWRWSRRNRRRIGWYS
jgi:hypothetical protein